MATRETKARSGRRAGRASDNRAVYTTFIILATWVVICSAVYVWCQKEVIKTGYETSRALALHKKLLKVNRALKVEVAMLSSPERIERLAREELGMTHPTVKRKLILR